MNVDNLPGLFFLDTNVFVYSFDASDPEKQTMARDLIHDALRTQRGAISTQVIQEFLSVGQRKFAHPLTVSEAREYLRSVLVPLCLHYPSIAFYDRALMLREETGYSFYDSLVVTAAIEIGCTTVLSEDLQHGRKIGGVTIANPFIS